MNKARVETISDGVFSIVMTLLIFDIKVPMLGSAASASELWAALLSMWPVFATYAFSFLVLSVFWINHHFLFHTYARAVNRPLNLLNMTYLMFLAFIPFSANLFGTFNGNDAAAMMYGLNILAVAVMSRVMQEYIVRHPAICSERISRRQVIQARVRMNLTISCYVLGMLVSPWFILFSIVLYGFPLVFNIIPGTLDLAEHLLGLELG